jgi:predicted nicotinamide N-methyase
VESVPLGDRPATVARPADWQVLRETEAEHGRDSPYWAILWPSGEALAQAVADEPPPAGARVLELGCGLALPSVAAARAGATVLATDGSPDAVAFAAHTLALDEQVGDVAAIDWREPRMLLE